MPLPVALFPSPKASEVGCVSSLIHFQNTGGTGGWRHPVAWALGNGDIPAGLSMPVSHGQGLSQASVGVRFFKAVEAHDICIF